MIAFWALLLCAIAMVLAQDVYPGQAVYHYGWYSTVDAVLMIAAARALRGRATRGTVIAAFGAAVVVLTGVGSGLMGPDTQMIIGAPGAGVRSEDVGATFTFPLSRSDGVVELQRGNTVTRIAVRPTYTGGFVMWQAPRTVVYVDAQDANGNHLTITQPTNASFLSPVLLMQQSTTIAGMNVRFDTFSLPAAARTVRAVLFTPQQAQLLRADPPISGKAALLFQVSDTRDREVPRGIVLAASGERKAVGGVLLRGTVDSYPAVMVASAPYLPILALGLIGVVSGAIVSARR